MSIWAQVFRTNGPCHFTYISLNLYILDMITRSWYELMNPEAYFNLERRASTGHV